MRGRNFVMCPSTCQTQTGRSAEWLEISSHSFLALCNCEAFLRYKYQAHHFFSGGNGSVHNTCFYLQTLSGFFNISQYKKRQRVVRQDLRLIVLTQEKNCRLCRCILTKAALLPQLFKNSKSWCRLICNQNCLLSARCWFTQSKAPGIPSSGCDSHIYFCINASFILLIDLEKTFQESYLLLKLHP